jgi:hypothetical protein
MNSMKPTIKFSILWIDCGGGLLVGGLMMIFSEPLIRLFELPGPVFFAVATANLLYGGFAMFVATVGQRSARLIASLAVANALWGFAALGIAICFLSTASLFGLAHLVIESAVVFWLASKEWPLSLEIQRGNG